MNKAMTKDVAYWESQGRRLLGVAVQQPRRRSRPPAVLRALGGEVGGGTQEPALLPRCALRRARHGEDGHLPGPGTEPGVAHVHPRRLLARARQEGPLVRRRGAREARGHGGSAELCALPRRDNRGHRAPDPPGVRMALPERRPLRCALRQPLRVRPLGRRSPHRDDDGRALADLRARSAQEGRERRARDQRRLRSARRPERALDQQRRAAEAGCG